MAKSDKVKPGADIDGVSDRVLKTFVRQAADLKGVKDAANMEYAGHFKEADEKGINSKAIKQVMRLQAMSPADRSAWLRAFDKYRATFGLDDQTELELGDEADEGGDVVGSPRRRGSNGEARADA